MDERLETVGLRNTAHEAAMKMDDKKLSISLLFLMLMARQRNPN
jgi:hypothetical protein